MFLRRSQEETTLHLINPDREYKNLITEHVKNLPCYETFIFACFINHIPPWRPHCIWPLYQIVIYYTIPMMKEILNLKKLDEVLSEKWNAILDPEPEKQRNAIIDYLTFLRDQYEAGTIGYMMYPYYVTSLLAIDNMETRTELENILDLAPKLEIPNPDSQTNPRSRLEETDRLSQLITDLEENSTIKSKDNT